MKDEPKPSRASVLHAVIEEILTRKDGQIPTNVDGIDRFFNGIEDLTNVLLLRWHTRLVASLERGLVDDPEDREEIVIEAWRHATWMYWGVRMVIDELAANPPTEAVGQAVQTTARNDWAIMAVTAGLASGFDEAAVRAGHQLEFDARRRNRAEHSTGRDTQPRTVLDRIKATITG